MTETRARCKPLGSLTEGLTAFMAVYTVQTGLGSFVIWRENRDAIPVGQADDTGCDAVIGQRGGG